MIRLPHAIVWRLLRWARRRMVRTEHDQVIRTLDGRPYIYRWYIFNKSRWLPKVYLHLIVLSDDDRALHDHPWVNASVVLDGTYAEILGAQVVMGFDKFIPHRIVRAGDLVIRRASVAHRLVVTPGQAVISLFLMAPKSREWGFLCPQGWRHQRVFTQRVGDGRHTRGCE